MSTGPGSRRIPPNHTHTCCLPSQPPQLGVPDELPALAPLHWAESLGSGAGRGRAALLLLLLLLLLPLLMLQLIEGLGAAS